ncbi:MAG TPA: FG-GAP-like repeat-containing protein, partial [Ktedonobacteraceae bacterium]|nr:FG-GAP-like repeat-containing protein [Ktedonobacteraceae bacterium]
WQQIYLSAIRYSNYGTATAPHYLVNVVFHYETRKDAFSSRRAGFEIRTTRLCREIEVSIDTGTKEVTRRYTLEYDEAPFNHNALLTHFIVTGYAGELTERMPALEFAYTQFAPGVQKFLALSGQDQPAGSLAHPDYELADVDGNGLPDFLSIDGTAYYWRNLGGGKLDARRQLPMIPAGIRLQDPGAQLIDADGDGHIDLMVFNERFAGYYPLAAQQQPEQRSFQPYRVAPSIDLKDPEVRLVDLTGNGVTDALRTGTRLECFFSDPIQGWNDVRAVPRRALDAFPNVNFSDPRIQLASMTGDTLQDIVFLSSGHVEYWPSLGYGNWGSRIIMANSPRFPYGYDPQRVLLGDVDGDGVADLVYVGDQQVSLWINQNGNSWSEEIIIRGTPPAADANALRLADLLGTGVSGVLWSAPANGT